MLKTPTSSEIKSVMLQESGPATKIDPNLTTLSWHFSCNFNQNLALSSFFRSHFIFQWKGLSIITSVSKWVTVSLRSSKLECEVDLLYSTRTTQRFLIWRRSHVGILLTPARTNTLSLFQAMERILASLAEVLSGQRESIASGFVKPSAEF